MITKDLTNEILAQSDYYYVNFESTIEKLWPLQWHEGWGGGG